MDSRFKNSFYFTTLVLCTFAGLLTNIRPSFAQFKSTHTKVQLGEIPAHQNKITFSLENKSRTIINTVTQIEGEFAIVIKENLNLYPGEIINFSLPIQSDFKGKIQQFFTLKVNNCENLLKIQLTGKYSSNWSQTSQKCPDFKKSKKGKLRVKPIKNSKTHVVGTNPVIIPVEDNLAIESKPLNSEKFKKNNIIFLIDVSSSMQSNRKKEIVYEAFTGLAEIIRPSDQITILAYSGQAQVVMETTINLAQNELFRVIENLENNGFTNGSRGIQFAYQLADSIFITHANNEIILLTDGAFNTNETEEISADIIAKYAGSGIKLSVIGIENRNWAAKELKELCETGNGNYSGVKSKRSAKKALKRTLKNHAKSKSQGI